MLIADKTHRQVTPYELTIYCTSVDKTRIFILKYKCNVNVVDGCVSDSERVNKLVLK